jgi:tryptophan-rich sensory protein
MMGVAAWLVWRERGLRSRELGAWGVQLALNALWTPLFFGLRRPDLAFVEIVLLWLAVAATLTLFLRARRLAGLLLVPYLAWVSFAAALNAALWSAN